MQLRFLTKLIFVNLLIYGQNLSVPFKETNNDLIEIFAQFVNYNVIMHFDNTTKDVFDNVIIHITGPLLIINYDMGIIQHRPTGYKFLNIICFKNLLRFQIFSDNCTNIKKNDVLLFINIEMYSNSSIMFWQLQHLQQAQGLFIYDLTTKRLHYKCFYCGLNSKHLQEISSKNFTNISNYFFSYTNFHGHNFRIGYISFIPFFWCKISRTDCTGPEANLLQLLSEKLNFQYTLVNFEHTPSGTGTWRTLVNAVHNKTVDWGIGGISLSPERSSLTDLSRVIHSEAYTILYHCHVSETWNSWKQVFKPFSFSLWTCIGFVFICIIFLLKYLPDSTKPNTVKNIEILVRGFFEQPLRRLPINSMAKRLIFIGWLYTCIILITAYKSKVVSMLIDSHYEEFESIQELLHHGYTFQVSNQDWSVLKENWEASSKLDKSFYEILKKTSSNQSTCDVVEQMLKNKVAYIDETSTMLYQVTLCQSFINQDPFSQLCLIDKEVFPSYHIWPMQLGAAYRHRFSYVIETLHSVGILSFWYNSALEELLIKTSNNQQPKSTSGLTLTTMTSSLFILGFGLAVSVVLFVFELVYYHSDTISKIFKKYSF